MPGSKTERCVSQLASFKLDKLQRDHQLPAKRNSESAQVACSLASAFDTLRINCSSSHEILRQTGLTIPVFEASLELEELVGAWRELGSLNNVSYLKLAWSTPQARKAVSIQPQ